MKLHVTFLFYLWLVLYFLGDLVQVVYNFKASGRLWLHKKRHMHVF